MKCSGGQADVRKEDERLPAASELDDPARGPCSGERRRAPDAEGVGVELMELGEAEQFRSLLEEVVDVMLAKGPRSL